MKALILVDVQRDFMPDGRLPVEGGDQIVPVINRVIERYPLVAVTQDWHPKGHASFASSHPGKKPFDVIDLDGLEQTLWPDHCEWGSAGAGFPESLQLDTAVAIFRKGVVPRVDSYSGFFDNGRKRKTGLAEWLQAMEVDTVHVAGLAAEICVAYTARDAAELGFKTAIVEDATRALSRDDFETAKRKLREKGVTIAPSSELAPD